MTLDYDYLIVLFWDYNRHIRTRQAFSLASPKPDPHTMRVVLQAGCHPATGFLYTRTGLKKALPPLRSLCFTHGQYCCCDIRKPENGSGMDYSKRVFDTGSDRHVRHHLIGGAFCDCEFN